MVRVLELAIISIVLAAAAILGFIYLKTCLSTSQNVRKLRQVLQDLETTFIYLKSTRYHVCLRISRVETANSTVVLNDKVLVVEHVVKIYIGDTDCSCVWYRPWLCMDIHKMCGIVDLSRLGDRYYILHSSLLCGYVNVWIERIGDVLIVHIS